MKEIWRRGDWWIRYDSDCTCGNRRSVSIDVMHSAPGAGWHSCPKHYHAKRWFGRNRTVTECVGLALAYIANIEAEKRRAELEAELASEEADALAEFATEIAPEFEGAQ